MATAGVITIDDEFSGLQFFNGRRPDTGANDMQAAMRQSILDTDA